MKLYQIYFPELATYVKFKVLDPEEVRDFLSSQNPVTSQVEFIKFKKTVIDFFVFNLKSEISDSLRMMSRKSAEKTVDALFCGCVMLNPGLDLDGWINIAYDAPKSTDQFLFNSDLEEDLISKEFIEKIKKLDKRFPKLDSTDFATGDSEKNQPSAKHKPITKQKFLGLNSYLQESIIRSRTGNIDNC